MVTLRPATTDDLPFLEGLRHETMRRVVENHLPWNDDAQRERVLFHFDCAQIIVVDGRDVGLWKVVRKPDEIHLCQIQIDPGQQGQGIGTRLIQGLQTEANRLGRRITLHAYRSNPAVSLYHRLGFHIEDEAPASLLMAYLPQAKRPPETLSFDRVVLRFSRVAPGNRARGFVPSHHFRILTADGTDIGHINFRVGDTEHVRVSAGHIGFEITEAFRGHGYALQACRALAPFARTVSETVTITCDPDNLASRRTIERLGAQFIDEVAVPIHDPHYQRGSCTKRRYQWQP